MSYPDLNTLCRLCLNKDDEQINIFESTSDLPMEKQISVPLRIMACVALEVHVGDALPKVICRACRYQLERTFVFRKRAQLSDSKLRKHIRLLNAGKVSNVFQKSDDDDEEELELENSLEFLKEEEKEREKEKEELLEKVRLEHRRELENVKNVYAAKFTKDLTERVALLKKDIMAETTSRLRNEIEKKLREELRAELKEECQEIEKENLLKDLELYLRERQQHTNSSPEKAKEACQQTSLIKVKTYKRNRSPEVPMRILRSKKNKKSATSSTDIDGSEQVVHETFELQKCDDTENRDEGNYVIFDSDSNTYKAEFVDNNDEENYEGSEEGEQYILSDNNNTELSVYQINVNDEIQAVDKDDDSHVVYLNMDDVAANEDEEVLEFLDIKDEKKKKSTTFFANVNSEDEPTIYGYTKLPNKNGTTSNEQTSKELVFYGTSTDTPKTFKCDLCPFVFSTENVLNRHLKTHQRLEQKGVTYKCPECQMIFSCLSALNRHAIIHTGKRPYKCDECGKSFVQREILKRHQKVHTGERPHKCPHCPRAYTQKVNLQQHINHNHSKMPKLHQHSCHLCPKRFNHASGLSRHLTSHSGITYKCIRCDRRFGDRSSVKRHVQTVHLLSSKSVDSAIKYIKECRDIIDDKQNNECIEA